MENHKFLIFKIIMLLVLLFSPFRAVFAYGVDTHAYLTNESVKFYSQKFSSDKISSDLTNYLLDGARQEDNSLRWMNHFYDPVYDRGLSFDNKIDPLYVGYWQKSKDWANDSSNQKKLKYRIGLNIASILTVVEQKNIDAITAETDFTWDKAIRYYVRGEKEEAMYMLGHILHLVQDSSVPDHTRNDPHPGDSVYEKYTLRFTLENPDNDLSKRLIGKSSYVFDDLNSYFNDLAKYSNNNFYTKDTINKKIVYSLPEVKYDAILSDGRDYGMNSDKEFGDYPIIENIKDSNVAKEEFLRRPLLLSSYWSRLSTKSVQYSTGVIDLFFREAEKAKNNPNFVKEEPKSLLGQAIENIQNFIVDKIVKTKDLFAGLNFNLGENKGDFQLVDEIVLDSKDVIKNQNGNTIDDTNNLKTENKIIDEDEAEENEPIIKNEDNTTQTLAENQNKEISQNSVKDSEGLINNLGISETCKFNTSKTTIRQKLLINELAWMGGPVSANDEWIELKNISNSELDLAGWQIVDKDEQIKINLGLINKTKIYPGEFVLLERTDEDSVPGIKADLIYTGALSNTDEGLRLFDNECNLIDEVFAGSDWPAGDAGARRTMERSSDLTWHTYSGNGDPSTGSQPSQSFGGQAGQGGVLIMGTPKKENSPVVISYGGGGGTTISGSGGGGEASTNTQPPAKILISEVQITGGTGKTNNDFIELYNPNNTEVNFKGYRLVKRTKTGTSDTSIKSWTEDSFIPAKGYYLWANSDYTDIDVEPDVQTSTTLASDNGIAIRFGAQDTGVIIDGVGWGETQNALVEKNPFGINPGANQSISRQSENDSDNNAVDFIKSKLTPKNSKTSGGFLTPEAWPENAIESISLNHIVISEIYPDRTGKNQDFIELYNPNQINISEIDLSSWSIQVLSASATSTEKISKKNFESGDKIPSKGFFLIGIDEYPAADLNWASGSLNSTNGATIFLVNGTSTISSFDDARIVDKIAYGDGSAITLAEGLNTVLPSLGQSLERKALYGEECVSSQDNSSTSSLQGGEFLGNGCDTDNNANDFEIRPIQNPQNLQSLAEPRLTPSVVQNFGAGYSTSTLLISLNWGESKDYIGDSSNINYIINYATSSEKTMGPLATVFATTSYSFQAGEIGVDYEFSIAAKDKDGLSSAVSTTTLNTPGFLKDLYFYKDERDALNKKYLIELFYDNYPFVADIYQNNQQDSWKILNFNLNRSSSSQSILDLEYDNCAGAKTISSSLVLPDNQSRCGTGGGIENSALKFDLLEDNHLVVEIATTTDALFSVEDFITVNFNSLYRSGGGSQDFKPVAIDKTKYYFKNGDLFHQKPDKINNIRFKFDEDTSILRIVWNRALDPDTLDKDIKYEINYLKNGEVLDEMKWQDTPQVSLESEESFEIGNNPFTKITVEPGAKYLIGLRAVDDFGNRSEAVEEIFTAPPKKECPLNEIANDYFGIDCIFRKSGKIKIIWRLLKTLNESSVFGIIPFLSGNESFSNDGQALHKDINGNPHYPLTTASESSMCNSKISSIGYYTLNKQNQTNFKSISGVNADEIPLDLKIKFKIYKGSPCGFESENDLFFSDDREYSIEDID